MSQIERCDREIAHFEGELRAGNLDMGGLLQAIQDWSAERRLLECQFDPSRPVAVKSIP